MSNDLKQLRQDEYQAHVVVDRLRREVFSREDPSTVPAEIMDELKAAEKALRDAQKKRIEAQGKDTSTGLILDTKKETSLLGAETTGLEAAVHLRMDQVPTAISHLFDSERNPLVSSIVRNAGTGKVRRVRVTSFVDGYSASAVTTAELKASQKEEFKQMPTFFPDKLKSVTELTRATLNVLIEDLEGKIEIHRTQPIWLLARTSAPLAVQDPKTGEWQDLTHYLGAFVTPNAPSLMAYLRIAADHHPDGRLIGYQGNPSQVEPQVKALFDALKFKSKITYVNSLIDFNPGLGTASQRVRLPRESLADQEANCIDGTVLFASLLEGISMNPAIVLIPGHAFVAWETWKNSKEWRYLETTMIGTHAFQEARDSAEAQAETYQTLKETHEEPLYFRRLSLKELRVDKGITPME
jgi:hypothetical protein